jgi:hypothetical protein
LGLLACDDGLSICPFWRVRRRVKGCIVHSISGLQPANPNRCSKWTDHEDITWLHTQLTSALSTHHPRHKRHTRSPLTSSPATLTTCPTSMSASLSQYGDCRTRRKSSRAGGPPTTSRTARRMKCAAACPILRPRLAVKLAGSATHYFASGTASNSS